MSDTPAGDGNIVKLFFQCTAYCVLQFQTYIDKSTGMKTA